MEDSFEKVVVDLVRRFSPQKKNISIPAESLRELKEVVRSSVLSSPRSFLFSAAAHTNNGSAGGNSQIFFGDDDDSRMSCGDSSEDNHSVSQYSNDEDSRSVGTGSRRLFKSSSSTSLSHSQSSSQNGMNGNGSKSSQKQNTRARRLQELRQTRRKVLYTEEFHDFDCAESLFPSAFLLWYSSQLDQGPPEPVALYHLIINSLKNYYSKITWDRNSDNLLLSFLREHVIQPIRRLNEIYECERVELDREGDGERRLRETQLHILLEMHAITMAESDDDSDIQDVIRKLRFLYIVTDALKMRNFLEEEIADNFAHLIPKKVVSLFDELCISIPADLEEHDPNAGFPVPAELMFPWFNNKSGGGEKAEKQEQARQLEQLLEETGLEDSLSASNGKENGMKKPIGRRSSETSSIGSNGNTRLAASSILSSAKRHPSSSDSAPLVTSSRLPRVVPDTPEEKLRPPKEMDHDNVHDEVVKQTPMGKLRNHKKGSRRLSELVKISEERLRPSRAAAIASEKASRAIISASIGPSSSRQLLLGLNTPSPRPVRSARSNLIDRFSSHSTMTSSSGSAPSTSQSPTKQSVRLSSRDDVTSSSSTPKDRKRARLSTSTPTTSSTSHSVGADCVIVGFGAAQLANYKQRMSEISKMKDEDLVGVASSVGTEKRERKGLFDETEGGDSLSGSDDKNVQKNRAGRVVRNETTVHLAHILLNVHNPSPLDAFNAVKMGAASPQKLHRLVRIAKKREKKKLNKLRNRVVRVNQNGAGDGASPSPSSSQKSDSMEH